MSRWRIAQGILYSAVIIAAFVVLGAFLWRLSRPPTPPLVYTDYTYAAERAVYAPGDTLVYTATLAVAREGRFDVRRGWRNRLPGPAPKPEPLARLCDGTEAPTIDVARPAYTRDAVGATTEGQIAWPVPLLPPGDYWLISSAIKLDGGEAITRVPVTITRPCPDER